MKKKKGFTLIELLAVIVILAIILLIATPIILNVINDAKTGALEITRKNMEKAAELYVFRNANDFSLANGEKKYIQLEQLEDGYIKSVKSPDGKKCEGYVRVESINNTIEYTAFLDCGNGNNLLVDSSYVNFGGNYLDEFNEVIKTQDGGYIAVGSSNSSKIGNNTRYGEELNYDAIIVKYDKDGIEEWSKNFGGTNHDYFYGVVEDDNGYVVVGSSTSEDGDMSDLEPLLYNSILVKYDYSGKIVEKKIITNTNSNGTTAKSVIYNDGNYYITGTGRYVLTASASLQYIIKYDNDFNEQWKKTYGGTYQSEAMGLSFNENHLILVGRSLSVNNEMADIKIGALGDSDATIFVIDKNNGEIIEKGIFGGVSGGDYFSDVAVVDDGYIAVGYSSSTDYHMEHIYKGFVDAVIVKYNKVAVNGILPIEWIKVIGGTGDDRFNKLVLNNNKLNLIGSTTSSDGDLTGISIASNEYYDGLIVQTDLNGDIINKKTYGGSLSDHFSSGLYDGENYVIVGRSFSIDNNIEPFNLGNSDAIMVTLDNELNEVKNFKLQTLLMNKPKELVKNYGDAIPLPENRENLKLYTTNDATKDLGLWCTTGFTTPQSNYNSVRCLQPFDTVNIKRLYNGAFQHENNIVINHQNNNWISLGFRYGNAGAGQEFSNLKLRFTDSEKVTVSEAVDLGYIEPLVIIGYNSSNSLIYYFPNEFGIIHGEASGASAYPTTVLLIKPKNKKLEEISFNSVTSPLITQARFDVEEFYNFDISLTPAE